MTRIGDASNIISGHYFRSSMAGFIDGDTRLIQPNDLDNFDVDNLKTIDAPGTELKRGDILLSNRGKFRAMVVLVDGLFVFPSSIFAIRITSKKYIPDFIVAYLNSESGQASLLAISSGSYISNLTKAALEDLELPNISIERQAKIAEIYINLAKYQLATAKKASLIEAIKNNLIKGLV